MKKVHLFLIVCCGVLCAISSAALHATTRTGIQPDHNEELLVPSAEEWQNFAQTLRAYRSQEWGLLNKAGSLLSKYVSYTSALSTTIFFMFFHKWFEEQCPYNGWKFYAILGTSAFAAFKSVNFILANVGSLMENAAQKDHNALEAFVAHWDQHKENTPTMLRQVFEFLAHDYAVHNHLTAITPQRAHELIEQIVTTSSIATSMTDVLRNSATRDDNNTETQIDLFELLLATRFGIFFDMHDCTVGCESNNQHKANRSQWEFIVQKLGILQQPTIMHAMAQFFSQYQWPLTVGIGIPAGLVGGVRISNYITNRDRSYLPIVRFLGPVVTMGVLSMIGKYLIKVGADDQWRITYLTQFIVTWKGQKHNTPSCLHALFDELYRLYIKNHQTLELDPVFVDELYHIIMEAWMTTIVTQGQNSIPAENGTLGGNINQETHVNETLEEL